MTPDLSRFLSSWSEQLHCSANQVRQLIGSRHWLTDGRHKERLLSEFLASHLPSICCLSSGFVFPILNPSNVSREVDILIRDRRRSAPLLESGDVVIAPALGLIAHIHVKSKFSYESFSDALDTALSVLRASPQNSDQKPSAGLFFYEDSDSLNDRTLCRCRDALRELADANRSGGFFMCVGRHRFAVSKQKIGNQPGRLNLFNLDGLAAGAFMANLLTVTETYLEGTSRRPELLMAVAQLASDPKTTLEL